MAWFGDGLSSLNNLKGQITSFTKEVLSEGIVEEIPDERAKELNDANQKCIQLQELLVSKDAEISLLRRQNSELQKAVLEFDAQHSQTDGGNQNDESPAFFWDPPTVKNTRDVKKDSNQTKLLQEQLSQATVKIRELEAELKTVQRNNAQTSKDDVLDGHQRTELLRAKQDMINRIIQMGEKNREAERNMKRLQLDEAVLVNDFRTIISQLGSTEQLDLIRGALKSLETENEKEKSTRQEEKSDAKEKMIKFDEEQFEAVSLKSDYDAAAGDDNRERLNGDQCNKVMDVEKKIAELEQENAALNTSVEELDHQHSESIERLLSIKEEIQKKHQTLQKAYEQLYGEYNEVQTKLEAAESKLEFAEANNNTIVDELTKDSKSSVEELTTRVKEVLRNEEIQVEEDKSIFEAVAEGYVEIKWKKDMLERRVTEISRELKDVSEIKESLQLECDDMQLNIESLLNEIQHLKSNLPSIPEASEERVASLETETESLQEEIERLTSENNATRQQNSELLIALHNMEATLRNQENLEAELRNTKQQLDIAQQQLTGASKNVENNENMLADLSSRLHSSLDENNKLRDEVAELRSSTNQVEDCRRCIEELKSDLQKAREELKTSTENEKRLETELQALKSQLEIALRDKEELDTKFNASNQIDDLEYDLLNMRKELDEALSQSDLRQSQIAKLSQDNERLVKENSSLLDQLAATQDESLDNIELLNTEMVLLEQKYNALEKESVVTKAELADSLELLHVTEGKCVRLENESATSKLVNEKLQADNDSMNELKIEIESLRLDRKRLDELEIESQKLKNVEETLKISEDCRKRLEIELSAHRSKEEDAISVGNKCTELEAKLNELRNVEEKLRVAESKCGQLEDQLKNLQSSDENLILREKLAEKTLENESLLAEIAKHIQKQESLIENNKESTAMARETIDGLTQLVREKDNEIQSLKANLAESEVKEQLSTMQKERDELVNLVQMKHNESVQYHLEIQRLTQLLNEQLFNSKKMKAENELVSTAIKEKEAELLWAQNELQVVRQRLKNFEESNNYGENCGVVEHSVQIAQAGILNEKCNALEAALVQEQSSNRILQNQMTESQKKEAAAGKELERLRTHLMEMEASYTEEALLAEQKLKELESKFLQAEERVKNSSTVYTSASIRANQQVETLQQQMALIVQQRDEIQKKLSAAEDKVLAHGASLTNLQIVLEQFQRDKDKDIQSATEKIRQRLEDSYGTQAELHNEISNLKDQLTEAKECLQAASRLSEQLDKKTERIEELTREVARLTELVNTADDRIQGANKSGEGKVDRALVKNLILGYVSSSNADKLSVLRVLATVLDFNESDRDKTGLNSPAANSSWFAGLLGSGAGPQTKDQEASLSAAFVRFLESESKPKAQLPALPISTTPPPRPGHSRQHSSSSTQSTLLLSNVTLPTFPDFVPARNTGSILKEVLKDS